MNKFTIVAALSLFAAPAFADGHASSQGDAASGEEQFNRQCVACHVVADADGNVLAGRNATVGPNLYGMAGRQIGSVEGFRYGDSIVEVGEAGNVWTEELFVGYVQDPTNWLRETLITAVRAARWLIRYAPKIRLMISTHISRLSLNKEVAVLKFETPGLARRFLYGGFDLLGDAQRCLFMCKMAETW